VILKKRRNVYQIEKEYEEDYKYIRWDGECKEENYLEKVEIE